MQQPKRGQKARQYSSESLMTRSITGIVLIALGVLSLLSVVAGQQSAAFSFVADVVQGLGGGLCIGVAVFLIWAGVLVAFSARRSMPVRGILLLLGIYFCVLAMVNLMSKVGQEGLMEYMAQSNREQVPPVAEPEGFGSMLLAAYRVCGSSGAFGGMLGMLLAWPLWRFVGATGGMVVLALVCIVLAMCFSRFDILRLWTAFRQRSDEKLEAQEEARRQREYGQQMAAAQNAKGYGLFSALKRGGKAESPELPPDYHTPQQPAAGMPMGYAQSPAPGYGQMPPQPFGQQAMPYQQPFQQPVELYDEIVTQPTWVFQGNQPKGKKTAKNAAKSAKMAELPAALQTAMTFTPSEVGQAAPEKERAPKKLVNRMEQIRQRKAELERDIGEMESPEPQGYAPVVMFEEDSEPETVPLRPETVPPPAPRQQPSADKNAAYKRPAAQPQSAMMSGKRLDVPELKLPEAQKSKQAEAQRRDTPMYAYPTLDLLNVRQQQQVDTRAQDEENAMRLEKTLESFGIPAKVRRVTHGPAVTRFELGLLSGGINVKRILSIADNIALEMAANGGVRIEIPIPGTNLFGVEVPNKEIASVSLAEVLVSPEMNNAKSALAVALGRDIAGRPVICDLAKMPHLLIAGQTGSGKSVCINTLVNSILYRSSPAEVRMIMIDPKVVELQCYNVVPHLLIPVVSDPHKAAGALAWAVAEMLDRYHKMQSKGVRELTAYNAKLGPDEERLPRILIIIDELADLMLACKKEVEESIIRLAQLARAAGIHMIVATQRPTVDVITGLIKANIPSRIAFAVSSSIDSRTILDANGAEKLLGRGDMFYSPTGSNSPIRVQGCFLSDAEIERVVDYIGERTQVDFDPDIIEAVNKEEEPVGMAEDLEDGGVDDRLAEAIEMVMADGQASISMLQRRMKIGYARAGRLIDDMAARGIVSKSAGSKPREILMGREEYERIKDSVLR